MNSTTTIYEDNDDDTGIDGIREKLKALRVQNSDDNIGYDSIAKFKLKFGDGGSYGITGEGEEGNKGNDASFLSQVRRWSSSSTGTTITRSLVSRELMKLNPNDRNAIYEEVHGVSSLCDDESMSPEMYHKLLNEMTQELCTLPPESKTAYEQSMKVNTGGSSYINDDSFKIRFLHLELFNAKKAAIRLANFVQVVFELFGSQTLRRPLHLSDFTREELRVFNRGRIQLLPYRDRAGRRVIVGFPPQGDHDQVNHLTRAKIHLYLWFVASEDIETQRKGMVLIIYHDPNITNSSTSPNSKDHTAPNDGQDTRALPNSAWVRTYKKYLMTGRLVRQCAFHLCTPDTPYYHFIQLYCTLLTEPEKRCYMKFHVGRDIENRYELAGYGIPLDQFPVTETGKIKTNHFRKWIKLRKSLESASSHLAQNPSEIIECPRMNDVVFRASQSVMSHGGNHFFRGLVESKHEEHDMAATREKKMNITRGVIEEVRKRNGRFLVWDNKTWWTEMKDEKQIYARIAIFFRNSKVSANAKINRQTTLSSTYAFAGEGGSTDDRKRKIIWNDCGDGQYDKKQSCFSIT